MRVSPIARLARECRPWEAPFFAPLAKSHENRNRSNYHLRGSLRPHSHGHRDCIATAHTEAPFSLFSLFPLPPSRDKRGFPRANISARCETCWTPIAVSAVFFQQSAPICESRAGTRIGRYSCKQKLPSPALKSAYESHNYHRIGRVLP